MSDKTYCYFDITIGGVPCAERVVMELFDDVAPKTCENFRKLCLGNDGKTVGGSNIPMTYKGVTFHRVIAGFMIQGGDYTAHDGTGGVSIYGEKFDDEDFTVPCDKAGLLAMANAGPNTNGSQFFITVAPAPHLTGRHVVFGKVVRGMNTVRRVEHTPTVANDRPAEPCVVADCGVMDALPDVPVAADGDKFPDFAEDCDPQLDDLQLIEAGESVRQIGNDYFKKGMFVEAIDKYKKAVRYLEHTTGKENAIDDKLLACHNNTAACALRLSEWAHAIQAATSALQLDADNVKALFRRGSAAVETHDYESAIEDLSKAHKLDPANADVVAKLNQAKEKRKQSQEKYAARFQKMFS